MDTDTQALVSVHTDTESPLILNVNIHTEFLTAQQLLEIFHQETMQQLSHKCTSFNTDADKHNKSHPPNAYPTKIINSKYI